MQELHIESSKLRGLDVKSAPSLGNVMFLKLKDIRGLKYIGQNIISGHPLEIRHLKTLSIMDCNQLLSIDVKCDILECL